MLTMATVLDTSTCTYLKRKVHSAHSIMQRRHERVAFDTRPIAYAGNQNVGTSLQPQSSTILPMALIFWPLGTYRTVFSTAKSPVVFAGFGPRESNRLSRRAIAAKPMLAVRT